MREAEIEFLKEQNELEIVRAKHLSEIEVSHPIHNNNNKTVSHTLHVYELMV